MAQTYPPIAPSLFFKSYGQVIGLATDVESLAVELERLLPKYPEALEEQLRNGEMANWLFSIDEAELANELKGIRVLEQAINAVKVHAEKLTRAKMKNGKNLSTL